MSSRRLRRPALVIGALVLAAGLTGWLLAARSPPAVRFQGYVEADLVFVGPEELGRLARLTVSEGSDVKAGDLLFVMDDSLEQSSRNEVQAALDEARARLERQEVAQSRPEEIAVLESALRRAEAGLELSESEFQRQQTLLQRGVVSQSRVDQARSLRDRDRASVEEVRRQITVARMGGRSQDIEAARDAVAAAQARRTAAETRLKRREVHALAPGRVQEVYFRPGEVVQQGRPVVSILPPGHVKVRFYTSETLLPTLAIGQPVTVQCDGCTALQTAHIRFISRQAEYTPPVIYSREERGKLVYLVEAAPVEPDKLRPGQPVTVMLQRGGKPDVQPR